MCFFNLLIAYVVSYSIAPRKRSQQSKSNVNMLKSISFAICFYCVKIEIQIYQLINTSVGISKFIAHFTQLANVTVNKNP